MSDHQLYSTPEVIDQGTVAEMTLNAVEGTTKPEEFHITLVWDNIP